MDQRRIDEFIDNITSSYYPKFKPSDLERPQTQDVLDMMIKLEEEINKGGDDAWDVPPALYVIGGPRTALELYEMPLFPAGSPHEVLTLMHTLGLRVRDEVHAVIASVEGYRHLHFHEWADVAPDFDKKMNAIVVETNSTREFVTQMLTNLYYRSVIKMAPSEMSEDRRREERYISGAMYNNVRLFVSRTRLTNDTCFFTSDGLNYMGDMDIDDKPTMLKDRISDALYRFYRTDVERMHMQATQS